jgi:hypothetical protein
MDEQELIQNPEALLALMQQAVQHLIEQHPDTAAQEAQLRAVAKAIGELEKLNVPVPDSLRQTKMTLVAEISQHAQFNRQLMVLGEGLTEILETLESATNKPRSEGKSQKESTLRPRRPRNSNQPVTPMSVLRECILQALTEFGGSARRSDVLDRIEKMLEGHLTPRDIETRKDGAGSVVVWKNNVCWQRQAMVDEGILRNDSKFGYWELNPDHASDVQKTPAYKSI